jgi:hypothetical protein
LAANFRPGGAFRLRRHHLAETASIATAVASGAFWCLPGNPPTTGTERELAAFLLGCRLLNVAVDMFRLLV